VSFYGHRAMLPAASHDDDELRFECCVAPIGSNQPRDPLPRERCNGCQGSWPPRRLRRDVAVFAAWIRFVAQPARKLVVRQYRKHAILDLRDQFAGRDGADGERPLPFACQRTDDRPLSFSYRHIPPMSEPFSKQSKAKPRWCSAFAAVISDDPAPITQISGIECVSGAFPL
jgi:hypothetical protein